MSNSGPDPERLRELGARLDEIHGGGRKERLPSTATGIVMRLATELVVGPFVGGAMGFGLDWLTGFFGIHTKPVLTILMFLLGAAAGVRNVMRTAQKLNAQGQPGATDDRE
ncbi:MAG TPA: AtpZ/AtpI family protein [Rhizomicrobium sp.]|jgi:ATP synthase protein I